MHRIRDERGTGGVEALAFGVLLFVFGTLVVATAWGAIDARLATDAAAREAARAYVESSSQFVAADEARQAATQTLRGHKRQLTGLNIASSSFSRCAPVVVSVQTKVPRVSLPLLGQPGGSYTISAEHTEVVDPYRSGLAGTAQC